MAERGAERGFTLLEVIVAFIIMAMVVGVAFETFSVGLRNAGNSGGYAGAVVRADSKLAELGLSEPLHPGTTTGRFDATYGWRLDVAVAAAHEGAVAGAAAAPLYAVTLTVTWGRGRDARSVTLRTQRVRDVAVPP